MVDQKVEVELELRDNASSAIIQIAKSVSEVVRHLGEMGKASSGTDSGIVRTADNVKKLGEKTNDTNKSMVSLAGVLARMAGPAGVVAVLGVGLYSAAKAMDEVAGKRLRFENLSVDLGLTTDQMSVMIQTFKSMGMSVEEANSRMIEIGTTLRNVQTLGKGSDVYRTLSEMNRNEFAKQLVIAAQGADGVYRAFQMINEEYNRIYSEESPRAALLFLDVIKGMKESIAKGYAERSKQIKPERKVDKDIAKEFHQNKEDLTNVTMDFINQWAEFFQIQSNKLSRMMTPESLGGFVGRTFNMFDPKPITDPLLLDPPKALRRKGHKFEFEEEEETKKESNSTLEKIRDSIKGLFGVTPKQFGGSVEAGNNYLVGEAGPEVFAGGGSNQLVGGDGSEIITPQVPGTIMTMPQFVPNRFTPQVDMPSFNERFGDFSAAPFNERFGDFSTAPFDERFGNFRTRGGGSRPIQNDGGVSMGSDMDRSMGPDMSASDRALIDVILSAEEGGGPSLNADISFKNVPPGVMTKADGDGFDNFKVNKSRALEGVF